MKQEKKCKMDKKWENKKNPRIVPWSQMHSAQLWHNHQLAESELFDSGTGIHVCLVTTLLCKRRFRCMRYHWKALWILFLDKFSLFWGGISTTAGCDLALVLHASFIFVFKMDIHGTTGHIHFRYWWASNFQCFGRTNSIWMCGHQLLLLGFSVYSPTTSDCK